MDLSKFIPAEKRKILSDKLIEQLTALERIETKLNALLDKEQEKLRKRGDHRRSCGFGLFG